MPQTRNSRRGREGTLQPSWSLGGEPSEAFMNSCIQGSSDTWGGGAVSGQALGRPPPTCPVSLWQTHKTCSSHLPQVGVPIFIPSYRRGAPRKPPRVFPLQTPSPSVPGALPSPCTHPPATLPPMGFPTTGNVSSRVPPKDEGPAHSPQAWRNRHPVSMLYLNTRGRSW